LKECSRCQDIVQTLLTFSRTGASPFQPVDLNNVVTSSIRLLDHKIKKMSKLHTRLELDGSLPMLQGDEAQLKQVVLNLITNALDAMQMEGTLCIKTATKNEDTVCLCVEDSGCGIPEDHKAKLFEPFFTTKPVGKGIGIGLSTCFSIVQKHAGEISVSSTEGRGSTFRVCLPIHHSGD